MNEDALGLTAGHPAATIDAMALLSREPHAASLKRRASPSFERMTDDNNRKRLKEESTVKALIPENDSSRHASSFAEELAQELQCGCCSELVYRPVLVMPCQHFFCGSCCVLWIRNGGTNCPACRGASTVATPFRALQAIVDMLIRIAPEKARTERERQQADEIYKAGNLLRLPAPKEASPEPNLAQNADYAYPCPHCLPGNVHGWTCPAPIPDPNTDLAHAWLLDDGIPAGHALCGNCENLLALQAPNTTKCDMCQASFCGIGVQGRCLAAPVLQQHPHDISDVGDLIQSPEVYICFDHNTVEVEHMLDYLRAQQLTPRHIYREIVVHIQSQPRGFLPLLELDLFSDIHPGAPEIDLNPDIPRNKICRMCASEVLLYGLKDWWIRERQKGYIEESVLGRPDCPNGSLCNRQTELGHAKEFNHVFPSRSNNHQPESSERRTEDSSSTSSIAIHSLVGDPATIAHMQEPGGSGGSSTDPDILNVQGTVDISPAINSYDIVDAV